MATTDKIDLFKLHKNEYVAPRQPALVTIKPAQYLAISGQGAPGGEAFTDRIGALYGAAYTIKMTRKFAGKQDYVIGKLECQWWVDGKSGECDGDALDSVPPDSWRWRLLIRTPDFIGQPDLDEATAKLQEKGKGGAELGDVVLTTVAEGDCVQMLHVGPYEREPETVATMRAMAVAEGLTVHGRHHEIYLSDPRRVAPEKLRTILRLPVRKQ
jgi:hypothetical protein